MKRNLSLWQFFGFAFSTLAGTLLHFFYDLTGQSLWIAPFSGVNESTWEHMKLLFFPLLVFAIIQRPFFREYENFWRVKFLGTLFGLFIIPEIFYLYNGVIGPSPDWLNISIFFVSAAGVFLLETRLFSSVQSTKSKENFSLFLLFLLAALFVLFTFSTPHLAIFQDPISKGYGLDA